MQMLQEFHKKFSHTANSTLTVPDTDTIVLRRKLIDEEVNDELLRVLYAITLAKESGQDVQPELWIEFADALADSMYVIVGTAVTFGVPLDAVFAEVHRSNMTKSMEKDTKSVRGKTLKGPNWEPPRIYQILREHGLE